MPLDKFKKIVDITYITFFYVTISIVFAIYFSKCIGYFNKEETKKKSTLRIISEIYINFVFITIVAYIINNLIEYLPYSLNNVNDLGNNNFLKLDGGLIFGFVIFYYQVNLSYKIDYLLNDRFYN